MGKQTGGLFVGETVSGHLCGTAETRRTLSGLLAGRAIAGGVTHPHTQATDSGNSANRR